MVLTFLGRREYYETIRLLGIQHFLALLWNAYVDKDETSSKGPQLPHP